MELADFALLTTSHNGMRERVGAMKLGDVKSVLDELIARAPAGAPKRKWWDAMADDDGEDTPA